MAVRGWFSNLFIVATVLAAAAAFADGPLPPAAEKPGEQVVVVPAPAEGEARNSYVDPRRRFGLRHNDDWKLMTNFAGGFEAFCLDASCRKTTFTGCSFTMIASDGLSEADLAFFAATLGSGVSPEGIDLGVLGQGTVKKGATIKQLGSQRWFVSGVSLKLFKRGSA